jgi:hypothetical protein
MKLKHKFSIYVPSTIDINKTTDNTEKVKQTLSFLSGLFGGATAQKSSGAWVSDSAGLVVEDVTICLAYCSLIDRFRHLKEVKQYAKALRDEMKQDAISLEIDNTLQFI